MSNEFKLDISEVSSDFTKFLELPGNERIIFSAIFGAGKTYFLQEYFGARPDQFFTIHLYPSNYSVASNEDIFELIKYDILYELMKYDRINLEDVDPTIYEGISFLKTSDVLQVLSPLLTAIPHVGKYIKEIQSPITKLLELLEEKMESLRVSQSGAIKELGDKIENKIGSIYENDLYTKLIIELIEQIKRRPDESSAKEVVLIIDDLDRIDPDHIFRVLNVFAVHLSTSLSSESENKFGVSRIILSCDIENIRSIFSARFGKEVAFNGYIDKFYSRQIFFFNNKKVVKKVVSDIVKSLQTGEHDFLKTGLYGKFLTATLISMIESNTLNLRTLIRCREMKFLFPVYEIRFSRTKLSNQFNLIPVYDLLASLLGGETSLISAISVSKYTSILEYEESTQVDSTFERVFWDCVLIIESSRHRFNTDATHTFEDRRFAYGGNTRGQFGYTVSGRINSRFYDENYLAAQTAIPNVDVIPLRSILTPEIFLEYVTNAFNTIKKLKE